MSDNVEITNMTHGGFVNQDVTATIHNLTIDPGAELIIPDLIKLQIDGDTIMVDGQLKLNATGAGPGATLYIGGSTVKLIGAGWVTMSDSGPFNMITGGEGNTLINQLSSAQGIQGTGDIGHGELNLQNFGTINALGQKRELVVYPLGEMSNSGILEGANGQLVLLGGHVVNTNSASIQGSVRLFGVTISGGTLGPGLIMELVASTLNGVTLAIACQYQVLSKTILEGTITNDGTISLMGTQDEPARLVINSTVTLTGSGSTTINGPTDSIKGSGFLINDQIIQGIGIINVAKLQNTATISASISNTTLIVQVRQGDNTGGLFDTNGGTLDFKGPGEVTGGTASSDNEILYDDGVALRNFTWTGAGSHVPHNAMVKGSWKNLSTVHLSNDDLLEASGLLDNEGAIDSGAGPLPGGPARLLIHGTASLIGKGTVTLSGTTLNNIITGATGSDTLTNSSTIQGTGIIGNNAMNLVNAFKGQILANSSLPLVMSMGASNLFTNKGLLLVAAITGQSPSTLTLTGPFANFNPSTGTLTGGMYNISGTFQFDNANIVTNAANITLFGQIVNQNSVNGLANFANNAATGVFNLTGENFGSNLTSAGPFTNAGKMIVGQQGTFVVGGSGTNYNQTGGTTTVDGKLEVSTGGLINITGGTLRGGGKTQGAPSTLSGSVSLGNPTGAAATFVIGDSTTTAGLISATNDYTQLLTGVLDVQIGGTTAGSQYSQLNVTGAANLNGTLNLKLIKKFIPSLGQTFNILTSSSLNGAFSTVNGTRINANEHFEVSSNSTGVLLTVVAGPSKVRLAESH
jgi:hypothetical protein